jgi:hypothetical protein
VLRGGSLPIAVCQRSPDNPSPHAESDYYFEPFVVSTPDNRSLDHEDRTNWDPVAVSQPGFRFLNRCFQKQIRNA